MCRPTEAHLKLKAILVLKTERCISHRRNGVAIIRIVLHCKHPTFFVTTTAVPAIYNCFLFWALCGDWKKTAQAIFCQT